MKYSCKQKHFWWFLSLSTPCMSHFHFYTLVLTPIPRILPWFRVFPALFSKFWHWFPPFPRFLPWFLAFLPLFPVFSPWFSAFPPPIPHPPPPHSFHSDPQSHIAAITSKFRKQYFNKLENTFNHLQKQPSKCFAWSVFQKNKTKQKQKTTKNNAVRQNSWSKKIKLYGLPKSLKNG